MQTEKDRTLNQAKSIRFLFFNYTCLASKITGDEVGADYIIISGNSALNDTDDYTITITIILFHEDTTNVKASRAPRLFKKINPKESSTNKM